MTMAWLSAHLCPLDCQHLAFLLFNSPSLATVYFCPSLRQLSYCGTAQKRERKESESVGCCTIMWLILTSLLPVCTAKVTHIMDAVKAFNFSNRGCVYICICIIFVYISILYLHLSPGCLPP